MLANQPADVLLGIAAWAALLGVLIGGEVLAGRSRRRRLSHYIAERGWQLRSCRYRWRPFTPHWTESYRVVVADHTGHVIEGIAFVTGVVRRKIWIDW